LVEAGHEEGADVGHAILLAQKTVFNQWASASLS
jgi:hypothetical protein